MTATDEGQRNIEVMRRQNDMLNRIDFQRLRAEIEQGGEPERGGELEKTAAELRANLAPDLVVEFYTETEQIEGARWEGRRAFAAKWGTWLGAWEEYRVEAWDYEAIGPHVMFELVHRGTGRGSGLPIEMHQVQIWTFRDGRAIHGRIYSTRDEALRALEDLEVESR